MKTSFDGLQIFEEFQMESVQNRKINQIQLAEFLIKGVRKEIVAEKEEKKANELPPDDIEFMMMMQGEQADR